ncbi:5-methylthioribose kinase [Povalibacter uvarum]|uniref:5-methylthioribose kinase n=1 Tax=Povalibacter uvarum TaxID=732238 RepID=A0A841HGJ5_9GAMM|nr:phosphotransferase [Povalibacter uvarum]MBB6091205.1 5-methylthioribose kinase [Povalibacter uvarum]
MNRSEREQSGRTVLDGGVASDVAIVKDAAGREVVVKEALPRLKVAADWRCDPARSSLEVEALHVAAELLGPSAVPRVFWVDAEHHRFGMERITPILTNWQVELSAGCVSLETAARAGELLALLHVRSAQHPDLATRFANRAYFETLRIEPFFIRSTLKNPQAGPAIDRVVQMLRAPGTALVHGDYSPKNLLARDSQVVVLDWEVVHWGDPRFDIAFCISHLLLTGLRQGVLPHPFRAASLAFFEAYAKQGQVSAADTELGALIGCLALARVDGDSPVNYLGELNIEEVRRMALDLIMRPVRSFPEVILDSFSRRRRT